MKTPRYTDTIKPMNVKATDNYNPDHWRFRRQLDLTDNVIDGPYGKVEPWLSKLAWAVFFFAVFIVGLRYEDVLWAWLLAGDWWRAL